MRFGIAQLQWVMEKLLAKSDKGEADSLPFKHNSAAITYLRTIIDSAAV